MKKIKNSDELIELHKLLNTENLLHDITTNGELIEFSLNQDLSSVQDKITHLGIEYNKSGKKSFEISIEKSSLLLFKNKEDFLDRFYSNNLKIDGIDIFIWSFDNSHGLEKKFSDKESIDKGTFRNFLLNVSQYRKLLSIFLDKKNQLIELERSGNPDNEIFIASKGEDKLLAKLSYKKIGNDIYSETYEKLPIERFNERITNEEWLSCFKNTVCSFFEKQSDLKKTFFWLYSNFQYLHSNTEKSYYLYVNKFSFEKVYNKFRRDKDLYFSNLNSLQSKLGNQLISIPLTVGAAVLTENFVTSNGMAHNFVSFTISCYLLFVIGWVIIILLDLVKQIEDIKEERDSLKNYYSDLYKDFKNDFSFLLSKSLWLCGLGVLLILLFVFVLLLVWFQGFLEVLYYVIFY